jgi:glycosyltransferase involved in cell wall biosynthesis
MACGTAVVSSNSGSLNEILNKGALLTPPDANAFADAILLIASDQKLKTNLEKAAILHAKKFSWENTAEKMIEIYRA